MNNFNPYSYQGPMRMYPQMYQSNQNSSYLMSFPMEDRNARGNERSKYPDIPSMNPAGVNPSMGMSMGMNAMNNSMNSSMNPSWYGGMDEKMPVPKS